MDSRRDVLRDETEVSLLGDTASAGTEEPPFLGVAVAWSLGAGSRVPMVRGVEGRQWSPPKGAFPLRYRTQDHSRTDSDDVN